MVDRSVLKGGRRAGGVAAGSEWRATESVHLNQRLSVTVVLRPKPAAKSVSAMANGAVPIGQRVYVQPEQLGQLFGADAADAAAVKKFAKEFQLRVVKVDLSGRTVTLNGTAGQINRAFGIRLLHFKDAKHPAGYCSHSEDVTIPSELDGIVTDVFGLDTRPASRRHARYAHGMVAATPTLPPVNRQTRNPVEFSKLYRFPEAAKGRGQCIALLEFGGGFRRKELKSYFLARGVKLPKIVEKSIAGGANRPTKGPGAPGMDGEVYLDIEVAGCLAPDAKIVVYFAENTEQGWIQALNTVIADKRNRPDVISISWGEAEEEWTPSAIRRLDEVFQMAALTGITVCCASGDRGVREMETRPYTVAFPASSPHVLACGGTRLDVLRNGTLKETVWNQWRTFRMASGGGVSKVFALPSYQKKAGVPLRHSRQPGRGLPDVAANASSLTGYLIQADGQSFSLGGTSAAAPLWAALIARLNEAFGTRLGFLTPLLYSRNARKAGGLRDITQGSNGRRPEAFRAGPGWDACTGLGAPDGEKLLRWLQRTERKAKA